MDELPSFTAAPDMSVGDRFAPVTANNISGALWVASVLLVVYTVLGMILRFYIKWSVLEGDDYSLGLGTLLHVGSVIAIGSALNNGLGKKTAWIPADSFDTMNQSTFVNYILYILAIAFSQISMSMLLLRLFASSNRWMFYACWSTAGLSIAWALGSTLAVGIKCSPYNLIETIDGGSCGSVRARWTFITVAEIVIEVVLQVLPILLVMPLQMKLSRRIPIILAFALRLPVIAFSIVHLVELYRWDDRTENKAYYVAIPIIWGQAQVCWALLSASIPNLKTFMRSFSMGFGMDIGVLTTMNRTSNAAALTTFNPIRSLINGNGDSDTKDIVILSNGTHAHVPSEKQTTSPQDDFGIVRHDAVALTTEDQNFQVGRAQ